MGICFSKKKKPSSSSKVTSNDPPRENSKANEENESSDTSVEKKQVLSKAAASLTAEKASCATEERDLKKEEAAVKKNVSQDLPAAATPLKTSSCTKEEIDAILIQCGRLSRNSSGKNSSEVTGQRRHSGFKRSYDFDNEGKEECEELDKNLSRPSPRRRTRSGSRERGSGSEGRRVSRSPGRRSDDPHTSSSASDKTKLQPAKMVSVPATEKGAHFVSGDTDRGTKRISATTQPERSRSPSNNTRMPNENAQSQSLSRSSSRKTGESPSRRNPMAEVDENSIRVIQSLLIHAKKAEIENMKTNCAQPQSLSRSASRKAEESPCRRNPMAEIDERSHRMYQRSRETRKVETEKEHESHNSRTLTRTRSSRKSSLDLDNNPALKQTPLSSFMLENIQKNSAISVPTRASKACSANDSEQSKETERLKRDQVVREDLMKPCFYKFVTIRNEEPQESAGSNSFIGEVWGGSSWEMNSTDSSDRFYASIPSNEKELEVEEEEVSQTLTQDHSQKRTWLVAEHGQRSRAASSYGNSRTHSAASSKAATPLEKKDDRRAASVRQSAANS